MRVLSITILLMYFCFNTYAGKGNGQKTWTLLYKQDGIEFYTTTMMNNTTKNAKRLVKVKNTNTFSSRVKFSLVNSCTKSAQNNENISLGSNAMAMFTYQACEENQESFSIGKVTILK